MKKTSVLNTSGKSLELCSSFFLLLASVDVLMMNFAYVCSHINLLPLLFSLAERGRCDPQALFTAPITRRVKEGGNKLIEETLIEEARKCKILFLWLDCDLEGEAIGYEVMDVCCGANPRLDVYRARFSALIPRDIFRAMKYPERPNPNMNDAVKARTGILMIL